MMKNMIKVSLLQKVQNDRIKNIVSVLFVLAMDVICVSQALDTFYCVCAGPTVMVWPGISRDCHTQLKIVHEH
jgi:hypothetical protein